MTGPKHLWSGDWERESAAGSRAAEPGTEPEGRGAASGPPSPPSERRRRVLTRRQRRLGAALTVLALGIAGVAYATTATSGSRSRPSAALEGSATAPLTLTAPPRTFSTPSTPTPTTPITPTSPGAPTAPTASATTPAPTNPKPISWLGMEVITARPGEAVVDTVTPDRAGDRAGLTPGDEIQSLAGHAVSGSLSIAAALRGLHAGQIVPIEVLRGGTTIELEITLGAAPTAYP